MNTSSIKKTVAVVMISVLTVLSGCSYDVPEGYKKELHSYEEAVEYAKEIDPDATVSAECEETELQTVKFRVWPAVIEGRECSVCSVGANVYNNGWAAGEFPIRYYRLDTDYDYYIISEILKSHPDLEQKDKEVSLWNRFEQSNQITSVIYRDEITSESFDALWEEYLQISEEIERYPVHKRLRLFVQLHGNYFEFEKGTDEEYIQMRGKMIESGFLED